MPFGSTSRWYSSFGGRTAACSGTYQIATAAATSDQQHESKVVFILLFVIRSSFLLSSSALSRSSSARSCLRISGSLRNTADDRRHSLLSIAG